MSTRGQSPDETEALDKIEAARVCKLHMLGLLDTPADSSLDKLVSLAAAICGTPISLVSLVDADRQWFKSKIGVDVDETPRSVSFCTHAIEDPDVMVIEDAHADPRFADSPLVQGDPHIRFYAGAPLEVERGIRIGTLCVIDHEPRQLDANQLNALETLRDCVVEHIQLGDAVHQMAAMRQLVPVCAWCHSVEDGGTWRPLYDFVSEGGVTHSMCPTCEAGQT